MPAEGAGKCATTWSKDRLQFKACNMKRRMVPVADPVTKCNETLDIVFLIDGSGSLGQSGWDAEIKAAKMFVDSLLQLSVLETLREWMQSVTSCVHKASMPTL